MDMFTSYGHIKKPKYKSQIFDDVSLHTKNLARCILRPLIMKPRPVVGAFELHSIFKMAAEFMAAEGWAGGVQHWSGFETI